MLVLFKQHARDFTILSKIILHSGSSYWIEIILLASWLNSMEGTYFFCCRLDGIYYFCGNYNLIAVINIYSRTPKRLKTELDFMAQYKGKLNIISINNIILEEHSVIINSGLGIIINATTSTSDLPPRTEIPHVLSRITIELSFFNLTLRSMRILGVIDKYLMIYLIQHFLGTTSVVGSTLWCSKMKEKFFLNVCDSVYISY